MTLVLGMLAEIKGRPLTKEEIANLNCETARMYYQVRDDLKFD